MQMLTGSHTMVSCMEQVQQMMLSQIKKLIQLSFLMMTLKKTLNFAWDSLQKRSPSRNLEKLVCIESR